MCLQTALSFLPSTISQQPVPSLQQSTGQQVNSQQLITKNIEASRKLSQEYRLVSYTYYIWYNTNRYNEIGDSVSVCQSKSSCGRMCIFFSVERYLKEKISCHEQKH